MNNIASHSAPVDTIFVKTIKVWCSGDMQIHYTYVKFYYNLDQPKIPNARDNTADSSIFHMAFECQASKIY
jgi:hypothetical protein